MTTFTTPDRHRLVKLLGLLGSDFAGERDAAALAAVRFLRERGITWSDVIGAPRCTATTFAAPRNSRHSDAWRETLARCLALSGSLKPWERNFLSALTYAPRLAPKYRQLLNEIAARLGVGRAAA